MMPALIVQKTGRLLPSGIGTQTRKTARQMAAIEVVRTGTPRRVEAWSSVIPIFFLRQPNVTICFSNAEFGKVGRTVLS